MKVILEILILKYLFFVTLASPTRKIQKFGDFSTKEQTRDYDVKDILNKIKDYKNDESHLRFIQGYIFNGNDRRRDYARYYLQKPLKDNPFNYESYLSNSDGSFDSTAEYLKLIENKVKNENHNSKKNEHKQSSKDTTNQKHKHKKNNDISSDSLESISDEITFYFPRSNFDSKNNIRNSNFKVNFDNSDDSDSTENSSEEFIWNIERSEIQNSKSILNKEENSKIKSLVKKLNKILCAKQILHTNGESKIDVEIMFRDSIIKKWQEMEIFVKLLMINNYKYIKNSLLEEIINYPQSSHRQILSLKENLFQRYYSLKYDISQIMKLTKKKIRTDISKQKYNKEKSDEVKQLYITQLRDTIDEMLYAFKQSIRTEINQFQLKLKTITNYSGTQYFQTSIIKNDINNKRPFASIYGNEPIIARESSLTSTINPISAGQHTDKSSLMENNHNQYNKNSDNVAILNAESYKNPNKIKNISSGIKSDTKIISNDNGGIYKGNELTNLPAESENPSLNMDPFLKEDIKPKITSPTTTSINKLPTIIYSYVTHNPRKELQNNKISVYHSEGEDDTSIVLLNNETVVETQRTNISSITEATTTDNKNLYYTNLTSSSINRVTVTTESEIDASLHRNATNFTAATVSDNKLESFSSLNNTNNQDHPQATKYYDEFAENKNNVVDDRLNGKSFKQYEFTFSEASATTDNDNESTSSFTHAYKTKQIKNITTDINITSNVGNSANLNEINQMYPTKISMINDVKSIKFLNDSHTTTKSLSMDQRIEETDSNSMVTNQINNIDQHNVIDVITNKSTEKGVTEIYWNEPLLSINKTDNSYTKKINTNKDEITDMIDFGSHGIDAITTNTVINFDDDNKSTQLINTTESNSHIYEPQKSELSYNEIISNKQHFSDSHTEQKSNIIPTNFTRLKENYNKSIQSTNDDHKINFANQAQESQNLILNDNQITDDKNAQKQSEINFTSAQYKIPIVSDRESNRISDKINDIHDTPKPESMFNVTNDDRVSDSNAHVKNTHKDGDSTNILAYPIANTSINYYSTKSSNDSTTEFTYTTQHSNKQNIGSYTTIAYNIANISNVNNQYQVHAIPTNATKNDPNEYNKSVKPIDGNIENVSVQSNLDMIPHDVNTESIQITSDDNNVPNIDVKFTSSDSNVTDDYAIAKSIDDILQTTNSNAIRNVKTTIKSQNVKDTEDISDSEKQLGVNDIASEFVKTPHHYESTTPPSNDYRVNVTHYGTTYNSKVETTTAINPHGNGKTTEIIITSYTTNATLNSLAEATESIIEGNKNRSFTDISMINSTENIIKQSNELSTLAQVNKSHPIDSPLESVTIKSVKTFGTVNNTGENINQTVESQSKKTTYISLADSDKHYNETYPRHTTIGQESLNDIMFNDTTEASVVASANYVNNVNTTSPTNILDNGYLSVNITSNLDNSITDQDLNINPKTLETGTDDKIIDSERSTPKIDFQPLQPNLEIKFTPSMSEKSTAYINADEIDTSTTVLPKNKINTYECMDANGTIVDCESFISSSSDDNKNTDINVENKKSAINIWPGVPRTCIPLFLASDGTVLKEIPSSINVLDAQTRNLCLSMAKTIIQLNHSPTLP